MLKFFCFLILFFRCSIFFIIFFAVLQLLNNRALSLDKAMQRKSKAKKKVDLGEVVNDVVAFKCYLLEQPNSW